MNESKSVNENPLDYDPTMLEAPSEEAYDPYGSEDDDSFNVAAASATLAAAGRNVAGKSVAVASATVAAAGQFMWTALDTSGANLRQQDDQQPADIAPADVAPMDMAPVDMAPADMAPQEPERIEAFDPFSMSDDDEFSEEVTDNDFICDPNFEPDASRCVPGGIAVVTTQYSQDEACEPNLKDCTDSDTGDESDMKDKDYESDTQPILISAFDEGDKGDNRKERYMLVGAIFLVFFLTILAGALGGLLAEEDRAEEARSTEFEGIPASKFFEDAKFPLLFTFCF